MRRRTGARPWFLRSSREPRRSAEFVVNKQSKAGDYAAVVDGQQRLTTLHPALVRLASPGRSRGDGRTHRTPLGPFSRRRESAMTIPRICRRNRSAPTLSFSGRGGPVGHDEARCPGAHVRPCGERQLCGVVVKEASAEAA